MLRTALRIAPRAPLIPPVARRTLVASTRALRPSLDTVNPSSTAPPPPIAKKSGKEEGTIASVFASLSGGTLEDALPDRFASLKQSLITSPAHAEHLQRTWRSVLSSLSSRVAETKRLGGACIPTVDFPTGKVGKLDTWTDSTTFDAIKQRGVAVIRNVIPESTVLGWKEEIRTYARENRAKGFPADNPQVYELYWTPPQLLARSHPNLLATCKQFLQLFHNSSTETSVERTCSLEHPLNYVDRLRIRQPGDAQFALGAHIDGGGVERWECGEFRALWDNITREGGQWESHDPWSLGARGERMTARTDMYDGPGQCGVFRPLQGWLSMSHTRRGEGTLKVLPFLKESTAYIVLRPFFTPVKPREACATEEEFLGADNWAFDGESRKFPGCSLGHNIELTPATHPHLALDHTMTSIPEVRPGDMVLWHCDAVHSVESKHAGKGDSSVLYIPAIPTTVVNWKYVLEQKRCFEEGRPPPDFPGGEGESAFRGRGTPQMVEGQMARASLGLEKLETKEGMGEGEKKLVAWCNGQL
ncbi:Protein of unknown function DUF1479 [Kalmanozyma brasiliensis GHG001]|uniref:DUF1479 domain protein n=1 Tax=Kalmanozyma brasiliensis (strain GHG001) TaxID=1365824 RepID=V5EWG1_KALBG|nr:Protein of unknown function DUF1479 [Kalmanozyma brasiliensis GHG001]EST07683.1 Protein of unknown function DUF1479 [Kalmanozyma brasiliensis GHG001]